MASDESDVRTVCVAAMFGANKQTVWRLRDGSEPSLKCSECGRATPMLIKGKGFDCCDPAHKGEQP